MTNWLRRGPRGPWVALSIPILAVALSATVEDVKAPRLKGAGALPRAAQLAVGGGEVALELFVGNDGAVAKVEVLTSTPPFTDAVTAAVRGWQFDPAQDTIDKQLVAVPGRVLVLAAFRPPAVYASPAPGGPTQVLGRPSAALPQPGALTMPPYPPKVFGDGTVLVEIEMSAAGAPREYRILGSKSGFDAAALEAVRSWRFGAPSLSRVPDPIYVYAIVSFREPVVTGHD
ncbi:MAG: TonB family protein [Vicinamibacterales bacterium]